MERPRMWNILHDNCPGCFIMINIMKNKVATIKWGTVQNFKRLKNLNKQMHWKSPDSILNQDKNIYVGIPGWLHRLGV